MEGEMRRQKQVLHLLFAASLALVAMLSGCGDAKGIRPSPVATDHTITPAYLLPTPVASGDAQLQRPGGNSAASSIGDKGPGWTPPPSGPCVAPDKATAHLDQWTCVEGEVRRVYWASRTRGQPTFIDMDHEFTALIWSQDRSKFDPTPDQKLVGQRVRILGRIQQYRDKPQIVLRDAYQIQMVSISEN